MEINCLNWIDFFAWVKEQAQVATSLIFDIQARITETGETSFVLSEGN